MAPISKYCSRSWPKFFGQISLNLEWNGFSGRKQVLSPLPKKKRFSPKFKRSFRPETSVLQKKRSSPNFQPKAGDLQKKNANTTFSNQNALWPTAKCSVAHRLKSTVLDAQVFEQFYYCKRAFVLNNGCNTINFTLSNMLAVGSVTLLNSVLRIRVVGTTCIFLAVVSV